ncbi:YnbE-like lipoprotein [Litorimonas taeanensis]|uniref:YnbE-like lipoprotein n=1 Tax=Litorimonas taeanensis TaxID=568099 RepID=A0A420WFP6_9PROT|nr:YnbE family lipoprotein [Litorimonas taeanensis]RKQ69820.1 YnbE-like lipoprotein [Litorimonas taeanensis]
MNRHHIKSIIMGTTLIAFAAGGISACTPTVKIEPSDKPIRIDLNVKIDQEIRVRLDKEIEEVITNRPDLF